MTRSRKRHQLIRAAAALMAEAATNAEAVLNGTTTPWAKLHPDVQRQRTAAMVGVLRTCSEPILDALLGCGPDRGGRTPSPRDLAVIIEDTKKGLDNVDHDFGYLHSSAFSPANRSLLHTVRRAVAGAQQDEGELAGAGDHDLGSGLGRLMAVLRRLDAAADRTYMARRLIRGAEKALVDAAGIIDEGDDEDGRYAVVEAVPDSEALENRRQGEAAQRRRNGRRHDPVFAGERAG